jgi:primosomal protein N' (replication factor Y)
MLLEDKNPRWPVYYFSLKNRMNQYQLPEIQLSLPADDEKKGEWSSWPLQKETIEQIEEVLLSGKKVIIFVNKLGYARLVQCVQCGNQYKCKNCSTHLRLFKKVGKLKCHFCEYTLPLPDFCERCGFIHFVQKSFGIEKVEEVLKEIFPTKIILRFDRDELSTIKQVQETLDKIEEGHVDILCGTQMLAKGHNFKNIKLVVVLGIDFLFHLPDFRAEEKVFQLLTQVSGRAGRDLEMSKVLIQTQMKHHQIFEDLTLSSDLFYQRELEARSFFHHPPFGYFVEIGMKGGHEGKIKEKMMIIEKTMKEINQKCGLFLTIYPLKYPYYERIKNSYHIFFYIKSSDSQKLHQFLEYIQTHYRHLTALVRINIDPIHFS